MFKCRVCETEFDGPFCPECGIKKDHVIRGRMGEVRTGMLGQQKLELQNSMAVLMEDEMVITKQSFFMGRDRGEKRIRYDDITTADLDRKGWFSPGAIQIYMSGHNFTIQKNKAKKLEPFYEELLRKIKETKDKKIATATPETSAADELTKFAKLKEDGIITEEEFEAKKKEILNL